MTTRFRETVRRRFGLGRNSSRRSSNASASTVSNSGSGNLSNGSTDFSPYSLNDATRQIWRLPSNQLSIHLDLPRICQRMKVFTKDGNLLFDGTQEKNCVHALHKAILTFNDCFPNDSLMAQREELSAKLQQLVLKDEGDIGEQVGRFLQSGVIKERSSLMSLLKFITLDTAAPSIYRLRDTIFDKYPYRGVNGSWGLQFFVSEDEVVVIHSKNEQSVTQEEGSKFEFSWKCSIVWLLQSDRLQVNINVTYLSFDDEMKFRTRKDIRDLLDSFVDEANAYRLIWDRPLKRQPVHKDIVRLCSRLQIITHKEGKILDYVDDEKTPTHEIVYKILEALATHTGEEALLSTIKQNYHDFIRPEGDISEHVLKFFLSKNEDEPAFPDKSAVVRILKCINQEILFPSVMTLRTNIYESYPFKDMKKGWTVIVRIGEKGCSVSHVKKEQSHHSDEAYFDFEWVLKCVMDLKDPEVFMPSMKIVNYNWDIRTSAETRKKVLDGLMPFIEQNVMYERILLKPMHKMSLHSDVVRFLRPDALTIKLGIEQLFKYSGKEDDSKEVLKMLSTLCQEIKDLKSLNAVEEQFPTLIKGGAGLTEQLKAFFSAEELFHDDLPFISLLKCLSSDMYFPAYLTLRNAFFSVFPFKDLKGTGRLTITFFTMEERARGAPIVSVSHRKREQSSNDQPGRYFEFEWELVLNLTSIEQKTLEATVQIVDYSFTENSSPDLKIDAVAAWSPFLPAYMKNINLIMGAAPNKKTLTAKSRKRFLEMKQKELDS